MADLIDPADDREAARFADDLIAITNAERAVINAAMAWCAGYEAGEDLDCTGKDQRVVDACRGLRLTRKIVDG